MNEIPTSAKPAVSAAWLRGFTRALPIVMGYIPIGFAYGVLAQQAGLSLLNTLAMSTLVYAGSSQLIAAGLFAAAAPALSIVATTFIVNLRHMLFSAALSPYLKGWRKWELAVFAYELTDESFALHSVEFPRGASSKIEAGALNLTAQVSWIFGTWLGAVVGGRIDDVRPLALDYTLPAMFIVLLVMQIKRRLEIIIAILTGILAAALTLSGMGQWSVILATLVGATAGVALEQASGTRAKKKEAARKQTARREASRRRATREHAAQTRAAQKRAAHEPTAQRLIADEQAAQNLARRSEHAPADPKVGETISGPTA
ncbi:MAG: AzlC family ABC transporter permease [Anaerolineae bacterium]|jgi:4-azaleucine resistance transporter AzlC|nr:AzlC family ABC transporter permease [Anaerolineae bacterium]